jgi:hypothetical protein
MNDDLPLRGGCLCGAIRYEIDAAPGVSEYCHCSTCRKANGSAFSVNMVVPTQALAIVAGEAHLSDYASSTNRIKRFCAICGSHLFIRRVGNDQMTVVTLGSLDDDVRIQPPARHVFVASKAPWHMIAGELPRYRIYPGFEPEDDPLTPACS